jgi:putative protease
VVPELLRRGVKRFRVELLRENAEETGLVLRAWQDLLGGHIDVAELSRRIGAHEQFGVTAGTLRSMAGAPRTADPN